MLGRMVDDFSLPATGGMFTLSEHAGEVVVLYFYPKDNTSGCTTEAMQFRDAWKRFRSGGALVVGCSRDSLRSHEKFKASLALPFELIADPEEVLCSQFGVIKPKNMYGRQVRGIERSTFVIDRNGRLAHEWRGVRVPGHVTEVLAFVTAP